jgi:hypothetical protein
MLSKGPSTGPRSSPHFRYPNGSVTICTASIRPESGGPEDRTRARRDDRRILTSRTWAVDRTICQYNIFLLVVWFWMKTDIPRWLWFTRLSTNDPKVRFTTYNISNKYPFFLINAISRFSNENFPKILDVVSQIKHIAAKHNATPGQATLAWVLAQGEDFVVIPGTKKAKASLSCLLSTEMIKWFSPS